MGQQISISDAIEFELIVVETVCVPAIAFDDHLASDEPEVDFVAADMRMEFGRREPERRQDLGHQRFEITIDRFVSEGPTIEGAAQRDDAVSPALRVTDQRCPDRTRRDVTIDHEAQECCVDSRRIDSAEVEQGSQRIRRSYSVPPHRSQLLQIAGMMDDDVDQPSAS